MNQHDIKAAAIVRAAMEVNQTDPRRGIPDRHKLALGAMAKAAKTATAATLETLATHAQEQVRQEAAASAELQAEGARRVAIYQDGIVRGILREKLARGEVPTDNPLELQDIGRLTRFMDDEGVIRYDLDGAELTSFLPAALGFNAETGFVEVQQVFRVAL